MPSGAKDIRPTELKDTVSQLNTTISTQNELIRSLQAMLKEHAEKEAKKDQLIENLQAQLEYLKTKMFGSTSEIRRDLFPGQMSLFDGTESDEKPAETILPEELIPVKAHTKKRKAKAAYDEIFAGIPTKTVEVDTLTEEHKTCGICGTKMVPIGHEVIRTEVVYTESKLERIDYVATTYGCPNYKDTEGPQFIKDEGETCPDCQKLYVFQPDVPYHVF